MGLVANNRRLAVAIMDLRMASNLPTLTEAGPRWPHGSFLAAGYRPNIRECRLVAREEKHNLGILIGRRNLAGPPGGVGSAPPRWSLAISGC